MNKLHCLFLIGILLTASSCNNDESCCTNVDTEISIKYLNQNGQNLFELTDGYSLSDITIYHRVNDEWVYYSEANLTYPKGIRTVDREDGTYLSIFPSTTIVMDSYSETKIEFSADDIDLIRTEIDNSNSNTIVTKVWYNQELKWEAYETEREFVVIK
ncbi:hypothetical protein N8482_01520 [Chitinophagales bacterium]|nr:hypothetical protein [Chitinophagales bacterium]